MKISAEFFRGCFSPASEELPLWPTKRPILLEPMSHKTLCKNLGELGCETPLLPPACSSNFSRTESCFPLPLLDARLGIRRKVASLDIGFIASLMIQNGSL